MHGKVNLSNYSKFDYQTRGLCFNRYVDELVDRSLKFFYSSNVVYSGFVLDLFIVTPFASTWLSFLLNYYRSACFINFGELETRWKIIASTLVLKIILVTCLVAVRLRNRRSPKRFQWVSKAVNQNKLLSRLTQQWQVHHIPYYFYLSRQEHVFVQEHESRLLLKLFEIIHHKENICLGAENTWQCSGENS